MSAGALPVQGVNQIIEFMEQNIKIPQKNVTYDYSIFKHITGNRSVKKTQKLKKSIMAEDLTMHYPILVTSNYEIIDGQHRFAVCKELGKPIYYEFADCKDPSLAIRMLNVSSKVWQTEDFLNFYVKNGCDVYVKFDTFMKNNRFKIANAIILFTDNKINSGQFKEGKLKDYTQDTAKAVQFLLDTRNTIPNDLWGFRPFVTAVNRYVNTLDNRQIAKLKRKIIAIPKFARIEDYIMAMKNLIR